jgi:hypothetical protein
MKVKIYQINHNRDKDNVKFRSLCDIKELNSNIYDEVFNGELETDNLESIYTKFNTECHPLHRGHSLSISDVVVTDNGAFYCDRVGFKKVDFDEGQTQKPDNLMRVVYVEPHKPAYEAEIENSIQGEQRAVQGLIELVYNDDDTIIVCNDEGKLIGMDGNRRLDNGTTIIAGPFFVVGDDGEDFRSLTDDEVEKYVNRFSEPEDITREEVEGDMGFAIYGFSPNL